jgi:hypothetical protein
VLNAVAGGDAEHLAGHALEKVVRSWREVAENQRFALVAPAMNCPMIIEACESGARIGVAKVAAAMLAVGPAVGVRVSPEARVFLERIAAGGEASAAKQGEQ